KRRQIDLHASPSFVAKHSTRRRLRRYVAEQLHRRRVNRREPCERAFHPIDHRRELDIPIKRIPALSMQPANSRAHLIVRVRTDVLHEEINQPRVALQNSENLQRPVRRGSRSSRWWRGFRRRRPSSEAQLSQNLVW